ncbi:hypothetical protein AAWM_07169 [Aspergillus awamori]|uniref:Uncharacterized protein n=2 Tax=Aspergillus TaxID=5052 RepID=A0A3F3PRP2_9EURO|nr:hypothetical protein BDQ94DRAFT_173795 [Aspergillus welwitschiae]KAI2994744.1 hypothetical protein CBS147346_10292 [Aspergillus niger]GCB24284.1 hypothetical protein AAWM_07169 [Aspergillus awamori]RDH29523.1 hypothetical protein BDQ94DRAFT_173795 [Aspergillus welwitschiae]GKZ60165.1 hypothetical protein AnigIFM49718_006500 [Aspergillus niger]GLA13495.1 hypothetical protein AnigIFM62618_010484 [Aspergillus niger]
MSIFSLCIALPEFKGATWPTPPLAMSLTTAFAGTLELYCSTYHIASPSTTALAAFSLLMYLHTNADGLQDPVHLLRARGLLMAQAMRIHA